MSGIDNEVATLLITFALDFFLFGIYVAVFFCIRKKRGDNVLPNYDAQKVYIHDDFTQRDLKEVSEYSEMIKSGKEEPLLRQKSANFGKSSDRKESEEEKNESQDHNNSVEMHDFQEAEKGPKRVSFADNEFDNVKPPTLLDSAEFAPKQLKNLIDSVDAADMSDRKPGHTKNAVSASTRNFNQKNNKLVSDVYKSLEDKIKCVSTDLNQGRATHMGTSGQLDDRFRGSYIYDVKLPETEDEDQSKHADFFNEDGFRNPYFANRTRNEQQRAMLLNQIVDVANLKEGKKEEGDLEEKKTHVSKPVTAFQEIQNWFKVLWSISDDQLVELNGIDYTLYLVFLRYVAVFCAGLTLFNCIFVLPCYLSGEPSRSDKASYPSTVFKITAINITGDEGKLIYIFIITMVITPLFAYYMLRKYRQRYEQFKSKRDALSDLKDVDLARFTIMVEDLPKDVGVEDLQEQITTAMLKIYPVDPVTGTSPFIRVRVVGNYNKAYKKCVKLKSDLDKIEFICEHNKVNAERMEIQVRDGLRCLWWAPLVDALDHYLASAYRQKRGIRTDVISQTESNSGTGFLMFTDERIVKDFRLFHKKYFNEQVDARLRKSEITRLQLRYWTFSKAYSQSDIIWEDLTADPYFAMLKTAVLMVILVCISILFVTPAILTSTIEEIANVTGVDEIKFYKTYVSAYVSSLMVMVFNVILIPFFIDIMVAFEDFPSKSERQISILNRNFFFMMVNTLFLPLTSSDAIGVFLKQTEEEDITQWPKFLASGIITTSEYFATYFIQLTFLSVGFWLVDCPHQTAKLFSQCKHRRKQKMMVRKRPFVDRYAYDLGYHMSYGNTTFSIAILYSTMAPLVPALAILFFMFKYYVDKYNLSFVYNSEFQGTGHIKRQVIPFTIFSIYNFQFINIGFFAVSQAYVLPVNGKTIGSSKAYVIAGVSILIAQSVLLVVWKQMSYHKKYAVYTKERDEYYKSQRKSMRSTSLFDMKPSAVGKQNLVGSQIPESEADNSVLQHLQPSGSFAHLEQHNHINTEPRQSDKNDSEIQDSEDVVVDIPVPKTRRPRASTFKDKLSKSSETDSEKEYAGMPKELGPEWLTNEVPGVMSEQNIKKLKNAYRHPFEFISPLLYRETAEKTGLRGLTTIMEETAGFEDTLMDSSSERSFRVSAAEIYVDDEDKFLTQLRETTLGPGFGTRGTTQVLRETRAGSSRNR